MGDIQTHERWLYEEFSSGLAGVLGTLTNAQARAEWNLTDASTLKDPEGRIVFSHGLNGIADGAVWILGSEPNWKKLSETVLQAAGIDDADAEMTRSNFVEVVGQAVSGLCQTLSTKLKREVTSKAAVESAGGLPANLQCVHIALSLSSGPVSIHFALTRELVDALAHPKDQPKNPVMEPADSTGGRALDLLFDVELPVSVSFGRSQLPLKDIIKLTSGSIVELNRAISEPVEIIVNNCVIARGDVVVVEGNYGVRIQEVVSRQERLRTLN